MTPQQTKLYKRIKGTWFSIKQGIGSNYFQWSSNKQSVAPKELRGKYLVFENRKDAQKFITFIDNNFGDSGNIVAVTNILNKDVFIYDKDKLNEYYKKYWSTKIPIE